MSQPLLPAALFLAAMYIIAWQGNTKEGLEQWPVGADIFHQIEFSGWVFSTCQCSSVTT
jgi:hypothetical protein